MGTNGSSSSTLPGSERGSWQVAVALGSIGNAVVAVDLLMGVDIAEKTGRDQSLAEAEGCQEPPSQAQIFSGRPGHPQSQPGQPQQLEGISDNHVVPVDGQARNRHQQAEAPESGAQ